MNGNLEGLRKQVVDGLPQSEAIAAMHRDGLTIIEAIKLTRELFGINLGMAKTLVCSHPAYAHAVEASKPLHDELLRALHEMGIIEMDDR